MKIVTAQGNTIPLLGEFTPNIRELAAALARIRRFTGHSPMTVAQHSCLVSWLVPQSGNYPLQAACHDLHEAITGDLSRPMKQALASIAARNNAPCAWEELEESIAARIRRHYGCPESLSRCVHEADKRASEIEMGIVFDRPARRAFAALGWKPDLTTPISFETPDTPYKIWDEEESRIRFLTRFKMVGPQYE